jgi:1-deoxyxylulose-5-phosphate synthase
MRAIECPARRRAILQPIASKANGRPAGSAHQEASMKLVSNSESTAVSRRSFLKAGVAASALAGVNTLHAERETAAGLVTLGKSNIKVTRLALGTGSLNGATQQKLGQQGFNRLVQHAYDRGIRFFETSESYGNSQQMLGVALKPFPRESYVLMSKVTTNDGVDARAKVDMMRKNSDTEYFDIMLLHWQHTGTWPEDTRPWQDAILEAEHKGSVRSHGASVHGLPALRQVPSMDWLQVAMIRMNPKGVRMADVLGNVNEVVDHVKRARKAGMGIISMKLIGEGTFNHEDRQRAMRFAFRDAGVDSVTVGYKSTDEIDEAIDNLNLALA